MLLRIWTLLLTVLLLAAPSGTAFAEAETQAEHSADELLTQIAVELPAATPASRAIVRTDEPLPPSPALSRVFRPPRST
ncbi:MAG: hypothetical protein M4D80_09740 [Myxococcota bacterium]|nr:hypothetical protein [Myxococcota bacterium]